MSPYISPLATSAPSDITTYAPPAFCATSYEVPHASFTPSIASRRLGLLFGREARLAGKALDRRAVPVQGGSALVDFPIPLYERIHHRACESARLPHGLGGWPGARPYRFDSGGGIG